MKQKTFEKDWGIETYWGCVKNKYISKTLQVNMNNRLPITCHKNVEKTIYITRGILSLEIINDDKTIKKITSLGPSNSYHIGSGVKHVYETKNGDVCFVEVLSYCINEKIKMETNDQ